jgi:hypothetical protein
MSNEKVIGNPVQFMPHGGEATAGGGVVGDAGTTFPGLIHAVFDEEVVDLNYLDLEDNKQKADAVVDVVYFDQNGHARRAHAVFLIGEDQSPPKAKEAYCRYPAEPPKADAGLKTGTPGSAGQAAGTPPTTNSDKTADTNLPLAPGVTAQNNPQGKVGTVSIPAGSPGTAASPSQGAGTTPAVAKPANAASPKAS